MGVLQPYITALMQLLASLIRREAVSAVDHCKPDLSLGIIVIVLEQKFARIAWQTDCCVVVPVVFWYSHSSKLTWNLPALSYEFAWSEGTKRPRVPFRAAHCIS